eukprot:scaffold33725_cov101-Isochrysis_galbana.AAC.1
MQLHRQGGHGHTHNFSTASAYPVLWQPRLAPHVGETTGVSPGTNRQARPPTCGLSQAQTDERGAPPARCHAWRSGRSRARPWGESLSRGASAGLQDPGDVGPEAHVQKLVGLVKDEDLETGEQRRETVVEQQVLEPSGSGHQDGGWGIAQVLEVDSDVGAACHREGRQVRPVEREELVALFLDLEAQLAGRRDDERPDRPACGRGVLGAGADEHLDRRQQEAGRLAGARLGLGDDVQALQHDGQRRFLHGGQALVPQDLGDAADRQRRHGELVEARGGQVLRVRASRCRASHRRSHHCRCRGRRARLDGRGYRRHHGVHGDTLCTATAAAAAAPAAATGAWALPRFAAPAALAAIAALHRGRRVARETGQESRILLGRLARSRSNFQQNARSQSNFARSQTNRLRFGFF